VHQDPLEIWRDGTASALGHVQKPTQTLGTTEPTLESRSRKEKKAKTRSSMRIPKVR